MGTNEVKIIVVYSFIPIDMDTLRREKKGKKTSKYWKRCGEK